MRGGCYLIVKNFYGNSAAGSSKQTFSNNYMSREVTILFYSLLHRRLRQEYNDQIMIFSIIILLLHVHQAMSHLDHDCSQISLLSKGGYQSLDDASKSGETVTWSYPLYVVESETQGTSDA